MGLMKRKRSDSEVSMTSSQFSSPPRPNDSSFAMLAMVESDVMMTSPSRARAANPSHLNSRTLKRFRDNRPSDEEVHRKFYEWRAHHQNPQANLPSPTELDMKLDNNSSQNAPATGHTLGMLYAAQQKQTDQTISLFGQPNVGAFAQNRSILPAPPVQVDTKQGNLHKFFNIATPPPSAASSLPPTLEPKACEDCGVGLGGSGDDDAMIDVDGYGFAPSIANCGCVSCGKLVCSHCSVSNMGEQRQCLVCAG